MQINRDVGPTTVCVFRHKHHELAKVAGDNPRAVGNTVYGRADKRSDTRGFRVWGLTRLNAVAGY